MNDCITISVHRTKNEKESWVAFAPWTYKQMFGPTKEAAIDAFVSELHIRREKLEAIEINPNV